jgi:hypothetical protein
MDQFETNLPTAMTFLMPEPEFEPHTLCVTPVAADLLGMPAVEIMGGHGCRAVVDGDFCAIRAHQDGVVC